MSADPLERLVDVFGTVLAHYRSNRKLTLSEFASSTGYSPLEIMSLEAGHYGPTLKDFFRFARALGEDPVILLVNVIAKWRADPFDMPHTSRASDFARLLRLGYHHNPGDFRELQTSYYSVAEATHAAGKLNAERHTRGVPLLDTVTLYVRIGYVSLTPDDAAATAARLRQEGIMR